MLTNLTAPITAPKSSTDKTIFVLQKLVNAQKNDEQKKSYFSGLVQKYPLETLNLLITALATNHSITLIQQMRAEVEKAKKPALIVDSSQSVMSPLGSAFTQYAEKLEKTQVDKKQQEEAVSSPGWLSFLFSSPVAKSPAASKPVSIQKSVTQVAEDRSLDDTDTSGDSHSNTPDSPVLLSRAISRRNSFTSSGARTPLVSEELFVNEYNSLGLLSNAIKDFKVNSQSLLKCFRELVSSKDESAKIVLKAMDSLDIQLESEKYQALSKVIEFFTSSNAKDVAVTLGKSLVGLDTSVSERGNHGFNAVADTSVLLESLLKTIMTWDNEAVKSPKLTNVESLIHKLKEQLQPSGSAAAARQRFS